MKEWTEKRTEITDRGKDKGKSKEKEKWKTHKYYDKYLGNSHKKHR